MAQVLMMIPPLRENLAAYAAWMQSPYKHACLLASFCRGCLTAHHAAGETIYIPGESPVIPADKADDCLPDACDSSRYQYSTPDCR